MGLWQKFPELFVCVQAFFIALQTPALKRLGDTHVASAFLVAAVLVPLTQFLYVAGYCVVSDIETIRLPKRQSSKLTILYCCVLGGTILLVYTVQM